MNQDSYDCLYKSIPFEIYKVILVGDSSVGKTSYLLRLTKKAIKKPTQPTIGVEYVSQSILLPDEKVVKATIWDTAGAERYKAITIAHYRQSVGALLFYDLTDRSTFENVQNWRRDILENTEDRIVIMLIGNKLDLKDQRVVSEEEARAFCEANHLLYEETSASLGQNVQDSFDILVNRIYAVSVELKSMIPTEIDQQKKSASEESEESKRERQNIIINKKPEVLPQHHPQCCMDQF